MGSRSEESPFRQMKAAHETLRPILTVPKQLALDTIQNLLRRTRHPCGRADESETSCASRGTPSSLPAWSTAWAENVPPPRPHHLESKFLPAWEWDGGVPLSPTRERAGEDVRTWSPYRRTQVQALAWLSVGYYLRNFNCTTAASYLHLAGVVFANA